MATQAIRRVAGAPARSVLRRVLSHPRVRDHVARRLIDDPGGREWLIHQIAAHQMVREAGFERAPLDHLDTIREFEDCYWLFSSNELNLGLSQLRFDEAAVLYRLLRQRDRPRVAELGRYKGGTTFLLAAAGAHVLSLENDPRVQERYLPALTAALERFGLAACVDAAFGDAYEYPVEPGAFDLVLVHCSPPTREHTRALWERWWPGVAPGGYLVLHATPLLPGVVAFVQDLTHEAETWHAVRVPGTPGENVFFRKQPA